MQMQTFIVPLILLTACQTSAPIEQSPADKPAIIALIDRDTNVRTDTADARAIRIAIYNVYARGKWIRLLVENVTEPKAIVVLFAGGKGTIKIRDNGVMRWGNGNFVIRSRRPHLLQQGFATAV